MKWLVVVLLSSLFSSCFLFPKYKRTSFSYTSNGQAKTIPVLVPRGYHKQTLETDSAGTIIQQYNYGNSLFYIAYLQDTGKAIQPIIEEENIPRVAEATGAWVYKGMDSASLLWREVRNGKIRVGYRFVPKALEERFDSATNFSLVRAVE